jgi:hypothetical protein
MGAADPGATSRSLITEGAATACCPRNPRDGRR